MNILQQQRGQMLLFALILITIIIMMIGALFGYTASQIASQRNAINREKALNIAEAGVEMALWKLNNQSGYTGESNTSFGAGTFNIVVSGVDSNKKNITVTSYIPSSIQPVASRIIKVNTIVGAAVISFHYGAQVGQGGLQMSNNSRINGSVFSNGNIAGFNDATITNDVIVAGNNHSISGMDVEGNVLAYSCSNSNIDGNLTYVTGGTNSCNVGGTTSTQSGEISSQPLPISQTQIDEWKADATAGGISGSINLSGSQTLSLGPKKINGDLTLNNDSVLTLTGAVYVTGNISVNNNAIIKLSSSYGSMNGIIIADGTIIPSNNTALLGSGQTGSHLLVLSTSTSDSAITVNNNATAAIFYTSAGGITVSNNFSAKEVTGYKLIMSNNATITYDSGLANAFFSSGPGGSWEFAPGSYIIAK